MLHTSRGPYRRCETKTGSVSSVHPRSSRLRAGRTLPGRGSSSATSCASTSGSVTASTYIAPRAAVATTPAPAAITHGSARLIRPGALALGADSAGVASIPYSASSPASGAADAPGPVSTFGGSSTSVGRRIGGAVHATADAPSSRVAELALQVREPGLRPRIRTDVGVGAVGPPTQRGELVLGRGLGVHEALVHPSTALNAGSSCLSPRSSAGGFVHSCQARILGCGNIIWNPASPSCQQPLSASARAGDRGLCGRRPGLA